MYIFYHQDLFFLDYNQYKNLYYSLNFEIFKKIKKYNNKIKACDPFVEEKFKITYGIENKISKNTKYDVILFLSYHNTFKKIFKSIISSKNRNKVLDPFNYYS